jgi:HAD superfamily hydrolase (TIGR01509 family)
MEQGVIWSLDGVLADTAEAHFRAWVTALAQHEIALDRPTFEKVYGMNNRNMLTGLLGRPPEINELETIAGRKEEVFRLEGQWLVRPMPGALQLLVELEAAGWLQAVTSLSPKDNIDVVLAALGIRDRIRVVVGGGALSAGAEDSKLLLEATKALGLLPERCVFVTDGPAALEAAQKTGIPCIAVAAAGKRDGFAGASPALVFGDLTQVKKEHFSSLVA